MGGGISLVTMTDAPQPNPLDFATPDHDRARRCGHGEVIFGAGKTPEQTVAITRALRDGGQDCVLTTRASAAQVAALREAFGDDDVTAGSVGRDGDGGADRADLRHPDSRGVRGDQ